MGRDFRDRNLEFSPRQAHISNSFYTSIINSAFINVSFYAEFDGMKVLFLEFVLGGATLSDF